MPPTANSVVVFSSINIDMTLPVSRSPHIGETMHTKTCISSLGGKGANVAVACARSGLPNTTSLVSCIGSDGVWILDVLSREGIDTRHITVIHNEDDDRVRKDERGVENAEKGAVTTATASIARTGRAFIIVDDGGRSTILVDRGANACVKRSMLGALSGLLGHCVVVGHLEVPAEEVCETMILAHGMGGVTVLNASPWTEGVECLQEGSEVWKCISVIVVNEIEIGQISGVEVDEEDTGDVVEMYREGMERVGMRCGSDCVVLVTLGARGVLYQRGGVGEIRHLPAVKAAKVVDTTGAGDTFTGYFASGLANGLEIEQCMRIGMSAAAKAVGKVGAVDSIPTWDDIFGELKEVGVLEDVLYASEDDEGDSKVAV